MNTNTVRFSNQVTLTMHDNGNYPIYNATTPTSGLATEVDLLALQASLSKQYLSSKDPMPLQQKGVFKRPTDGNVFLGRGCLPKVENMRQVGTPV